MFTKRITPFACIIISLLVALITFVGVSSYASVKEQERINEARLQSATFSEFAEFIENVGEDVEKFEYLCIAGEKIKWPSCCGKQYGMFSN